MRAQNWPGLFTNASPFALPPGAATEQVNLCSDVMGKIYSRGGMAPVTYATDAGEVLDTHSYVDSGKEYVVALTANGLEVLESPAIQERVQSALDPAVSASAGQTQTSYLYKYDSAIESSLQTTPPIAVAIESLIDGGLASTADATYLFYIDANTQCSGDNRIDEFTSGSAATTSYPNGAFEDSQLCGN
jgi:hypothetical protein